MRAQSITVAVAGALALTAAPVSAQAPADSLTPDSTITAALGARYHKGGLHNFFFGDHYRDLWATPIPVTVD